MSIVSYSTLVQLDINSPSYGPVGTRITAVSLNTTQFDLTQLKQPSGPGQSSGYTLQDASAGLSKNKNNITSGSYQLRSNKTKEFVEIPFTINGYVDENGFLNIETWTNTKIKGLLTRNVIILSGLNHKNIPIEWHIIFNNTNIII